MVPAHQSSDPFCARLFGHFPKASNTLHPSSNAMRDGSPYSNTTRALEGAESHFHTRMSLVDPYQQRRYRPHPSPVRTNERLLRAASAHQTNNQRDETTPEQASSRTVASLSGITNKDTNSLSKDCDEYTGRHEYYYLSTVTSPPSPEIKPPLPATTGRLSSGPRDKTSGRPPRAPIYNEI